MNEITYVGNQIFISRAVLRTRKDCELIYCTGGKGTFSIDGESVTLFSGELLVVPSHTVYTAAEFFGFDNICLSVSGATLSFRSAKKIADERGGNILRCFTEAAFYFGSDIENKELILSALGELIVSYLIVYAGRSGTSEIVDEIRKTILKNFRSPVFKLDEYLKSLPFSYDYLRKLFKKETGMTPHDFLVVTRVNEAKTVLSCSGRNDYSINEISRKCGFKDQLYFSKVFKKLVGVSPSGFLKQKR